MRRIPAAAVLLLVVASTATAAADVVEFAQCLRRAGATFYTASWCPHCARQARLFGDGIRYLRVVDCTNGCPRIHTLPTWTFADGSALSGVTSLDELGRRTRCRLGGQRDDGDEAPSSAGAGTRARIAGGAVIIDVPTR